MHSFGPDRELRDGDVFEVGGVRLVTLHTPGHAPGAVCFHLPELGVVFDAGTAMFRVSDYVETDTLDIFVSHAHLDHVFGLTCIFDITAKCPRLQKITVYAEANKLQAIEDHLFSKHLFPVNPPFDTEPLEGPTTLGDGSTIKHFPLKHPGGSTGFRVDWPDRSLAYVTDTMATAEADYLEHVHGVDLLVHECYFHDHQTDQAELTGHSCLSDVARLAAAAEVGRLVLIHINPLLASDDEIELATAHKIFPNTVVGVDRMEVEF